MREAHVRNRKECRELKKCLLAAVAASVIAAPANAALNCGAPIIDVGDAGRNGVTSTYVDHGDNGWVIRHTLADGKVVDRAVQYAIRDQSGPKATRWTGSLNRNPSMTMLGEISQVTNGQPEYDEWLYQNNRVILHSRALCQSDNNQPPVPPAPTVEAPLSTPTPAQTPPTLPSSGGEDRRMTFSYKPNEDAFKGICDFRFIYADGPIVTGTAKEFLSFIQSQNITAGTVVFFNSPGGLVSEALELGREIRSAGFDTTVGTQKGPAGSSGECYSSCTLAFLGGINRTIPEKAIFGVHRFSSDVSLSSKEALDIGQIQMSGITEYSAYMGVSPDFALEMVRSPSSSINILTQDELKTLKVITPIFQTNWEIKTESGKFYLLGTTQTNGGVDKMIFLCDHKVILAMMLFNTSGEYMDSALKYTSTYQWSFDGQEVEIPDRNIIDHVKRTGRDYVGATVLVTKETLNRLSTTSELGFMMVPASKTVFQGWTSDFRSGKEKFFGFVNSCH